jgi:hypothetical protein
MAAGSMVETGLTAAIDHPFGACLGKPRGLSERVNAGNRISRFAMDVKEFADHLGIAEANYCPKQSSPASTATGWRANAG